MSNLTDALEFLDGWDVDAPWVDAAYEAVRRMADLEARVDAGAEIWAETPCPCGKNKPPSSRFRHKVPDCPPDCDVSEENEWGHDDDYHDFCPGGERERLMG